MKFNKIPVYMKMAYEIAELSPDAETKVGALLLSPDERIIASSFNGFARGAPDDLLPNTRSQKHEYIQHAERNLLYNCCFNGIQTKDSTVVCTLSPCLECVRACWQSGIKTMVFDKLYRRFKSTDMYEVLDDIEINVEKKAHFTILHLKERT